MRGIEKIVMAGCLVVGTAYAEVVLEDSFEAEKLSSSWKAYVREKGMSATLQDENLVLNPGMGLQWGGSVARTVLPMRFDSGESPLRFTVHIRDLGGIGPDHGTGETAVAVVENRDHSGWFNTDIEGIYVCIPHSAVTDRCRVEIYLKSKGNIKQRGVRAGTMIIGKKGDFSLLIELDDKKWSVRPQGAALFRAIGVMEGEHGFDLEKRWSNGCSLRLETVQDAGASIGPGKIGFVKIEK
jgi:hypothetical protein